jgi:hypothetical protein
MGLNPEIIPKVYDLKFSEECPKNEIQSQYGDFDSFYAFYDLHLV